MAGNLDPPSSSHHFADIGHDPDTHDVTYENAQARERTQILMDLANKTGGMVIGTGDLSELALGWTTYNGDHMSMYGLILCPQNAAPTPDPPRRNVSVAEPPENLAGYFGHADQP